MTVRVQILKKRRGDWDVWGDRINTGLKLSPVSLTRRVAHPLPFRFVPIFFEVGTNGDTANPHKHRLSPLSPLSPAQNIYLQALRSIRQKQHDFNHKTERICAEAGTAARPSAAGAAAHMGA